MPTIAPAAAEDHRAPETTIGPATRVPTLLIAIIRDAVRAGRLPPHLPTPPAPVVEAMTPVRSAFEADGTVVPPELMARGLMAWTYLFGAVSSDVFGHRHNVVQDEREVVSPFFEHEVDALLGWLGIPPASPAGVVTGSS